MIASLQGRLVEVMANRIVLDVGGVGYEISLSRESLARLPAIGEGLRVLTHQHVREDTLALYGFLSGIERDLFKLLLSVSGIGPKVAITILSGIAVEDFYLAIRNEDLAKISSIPGIGRKTAERLVLELKEKAMLFSPLAPRGTKIHTANAKQGDATRALMSLGYRQNQAQTAVEKVIRKGDGKNTSVEDLVKEALKLVGSA